MKKGFKKFLTILLSVAMICSYSVTAFAAEGDSEGEGSVPAITSVVIDSTLGMFTAVPESIQVVQKDADTLTVTFEPKAVARTYPKMALIAQTATEEEKETAAIVGTPVKQGEEDSYSFTFDIAVDDLGKAFPLSTYQDYKDVKEWKNWTEQKYITFYPVYTTDLKVENNIKMFVVDSASLTNAPDVEGYVPTLNVTMGSDAFGKVCPGIATKATDENATEIVSRQFSIPVEKTGVNTHLAFWSVSKSKWYNRDYMVDVENNAVIFNPTTLELEEFEGMTTEEAIANASDSTSPELVDKLIETIYVQTRDENTDKYCAIAKAYWDALKDNQKAEVEEYDYFGRDTGDASLDNPRNQDEIGDKELLVVSFGTSFNDSRVATIGGIENALEEAYPEYSVRRAFTAQIIINHIQSRDGEVIDNMTQALDRAVANGVKELVVQPTHLMHGYEYDEMCEELAKYEDKIDKIVIAEPLLNTAEDKDAVAKAIFEAAAKEAGFESMDAAAASKDTAFVFMGHGTSHDSDSEYSEMQKVYQNLGYNNVYIATVEGDEKEEFDPKGLTNVKDQIKEAGFTKVVFRPLMVVAGDHANNDMADEEDEESFAGAFKAEGFDVTSQISGLGEIEAVQAIYVAHTGDVIDAIEKAEALKAIKANVNVTAQAAGAFLAAPAELEVNAYTAESYGYKDAVNNAVSALDVLVAETEVIFGEEAVTDTLEVSASGWITKIFGVETYASGFALNGAAAITDVASSWGGYESLLINQAKVVDGDKLDFFMYQDDADYTDYYANVHCDDAVNQNTEMTVNVDGYGYAYYSSYGDEIVDYTEELEDMQIATVDMATGVVTPIEGAVTDENGNATVSFAEAGTYYLTAVATDDALYPTFMTIKKVVVNKVTPLTVVKQDVMVSVKEANLIESEGKYILDFTFASDSISKVAATLASKVTEADEIEVVDRNFKVAVEALDTKFHLARYSAKNKMYYNTDFTVSLKDNTLTIEPTVIEVEGFEGLNVEQGVAKATEMASAELCDALIETIYVQIRDENTDMYCAAAKACWDALSDEEKDMVEEGDYFGRDTGDASKDNPRNQDNIGDKELLVVSFGTSFNDSRVATIGGIENALEEAFTGYSVRRAFTAQIIINHIQSRDGVVIDNMDQALERAVANGVKELVVQPTHLMHGYEYDEMCEALKPYESKMSITIAEPLLNTDADKLDVANAIFTEAAKKAGFKSMDAAAASKDTAFVFMGHGTSHDSDAEYAEMQKVYQNLGYNNVYIATVEGDEKEEFDPKGLTNVKKLIKEAGFTKVVFRPLMVVAGDHANNDMADEDDVESFAGAFKNDGFEVTSQIAGLGEIKAVQKIYVAHTCEAVGHFAVTDKTEVTPATTKAAGKKVTKCACGEVKSTVTIKKIGKITLAKTAYVYSTTAKKPAVTVKNSAGTKLASSNYTVSYKNNKKVGKATVTIKFKGKYSGTVTKTFKINPKTTSISKLAKGKKSIKVTWKKQATQTTGYQIRYSTKKSMSGAKTVTVKSTKTTSKTIKNLKAKKKYYVQVRTYKTVNGVKYYGAWSGKKYTTTK